MSSATVFGTTCADRFRPAQKVAAAPSGGRGTSKAVQFGFRVEFLCVLPRALPGETRAASFVVGCEARRRSSSPPCPKNMGHPPDIQVRAWRFFGWRTVACAPRGGRGHAKRFRTSSAAAGGGRYALSTYCPNRTPHRVPDPAPKSCGTCAAVCSSPAKPAEEPNLPTPAAVLLTSLSVASELLPTQASHDSACSCNQRKLPFPSSDVPLLI